MDRRRRRFTLEWHCRHQYRSFVFFNRLRTCPEQPRRCCSSKGPTRICLDGSCTSIERLQVTPRIVMFLRSGRPIGWGSPSPRPCPSDEGDPWPDLPPSKHIKIPIDTAPYAPRATATDPLLVPGRVVRQGAPSQHLAVIGHRRRARRYSRCGRPPANGRTYEIAHARVPKPRSPPMSGALSGYLRARPRRVDGLRCPAPRPPAAH